jgi:hypothetical protein
MAELAGSNNERVQKEAAMWIGNYAAGGFAFVQHLLECHAFDALVGCLRRAPKQRVLDQALYVLVSAANTCCSAAPSEERDGILQTLLIQKHFLTFTARHVGQMGCDTRTTDILGMWVALLKWNRAYVQPILEECKGLDRVDELLGSQNTAIYKLAAQIDDIIHAAQVQHMDTAKDDDGQPKTFFDF